MFEGDLPNIAKAVASPGPGFEALLAGAARFESPRGRSPGPGPRRSRQNSVSHLFMLGEERSKSELDIEPPRWPVVSPKQHCAQTRSNSCSTLSLPDLQLDPPLEVLPSDIDPVDLHRFRKDYQNFRRGRGRGARGEIEDIPDSPRNSSARADYNSSDSADDADAYYSEPERGADLSDTSPPGGPARPRFATGPPAVPASPAASAASPTAGVVEALKECHSAALGGGGRRLDFFAWLRDEVQSRPDEDQLPRVPHSHLLEVVKVPTRLEKLLGFGLLLCLDILLHELSFTPLQVLRALPRLFLRRLSVTEECDLVRLVLLQLNVALVFMCFDVSAVYHYIRGESFLKLYVIFNMLEMFERWIRSVGVDLFDLVMASVRHPWRSLLPKFVAALVYCFLHSTMHYLRVLLLNVAINTSSSAVFLIIVTNNFGEIKSTVFKRYEAKSLFPIITSDIVERFYLVLDIIFVLTRLCISPHRGMYTGLDIIYWLGFVVTMEIGTDWVKFMLILKFSELKASMLEDYKYVLIAEILLCRAHLPDVNGAVAEGAQSQSRSGAAEVLMPFRGIQSFSHVPARRIGFSGVPLTTLVVVHVVMLLTSPCSLAVRRPRAASSLFVVTLFALCFLAKVLVGLILFGFAVRRRKSVAKGLELFPKIKAL